MDVEQINKEIMQGEIDVIQHICEALRKYEVHIPTHLSKFVASICGVDVKNMFSDCHNLEVSHARWLFWYAYRYTTNETYEKIGKLSTNYCGKYFSKAAVALSVKKMDELIEQQSIWKKRWFVIKQIIKEYNGLVIEPSVPITITIPKNVELTIKKE